MKAKDRLPPPTRLHSKSTEPFLSNPTALRGRLDKLYLHAAVTPETAQERTDAIAEFGSAGTAADPAARGRALLRAIQNPAFVQREMNRSFVQMEYG